MPSWVPQRRRGGSTTSLSLTSGITFVARLCNHSRPQVDPLQKPEDGTPRLVAIESVRYSPPKECLDRRGASLTHLLVILQTATRAFILCAPRVMRRLQDGPSDKSVKPCEQDGLVAAENLGGLWSASVLLSVI
jgi:hypothetical protein